jgi:hypothetical protein
MKIKIFICSLLCLTFLCSCEGLPVPGQKVELDKTDYEIPAEGGKLKVSFIPLSDWRASCGEPFVSFSPSSGVASTEPTELIIDVKANEAEAERVAKIVLSFKTNDIVLTITQAAAEQKPTPEPPGPEPPGPEPPGPENPDNPQNPDEGTGGSTEDVVPGKDVNVKSK